MYEHDNMIYHAFTGKEWKHHKYIKKIGNKYIYPEDLKKAKKILANKKSSTKNTLNTKANSALKKATGKTVKKIDGKYYYADKKGYEKVAKKKAKAQMHKDIVKKDIEPYIKNAKTKEAKEFHTNDKKRQLGFAKKAEKQAERYTVKNQAKKKLKDVTNDTATTIRKKTEGSELSKKITKKQIENNLLPQKEKYPYGVYKDEDKKRFIKDIKKLEKEMSYDVRYERKNHHSEGASMNYYVDGKRTDVVAYNNAKRANREIDDTIRYTLSRDYSPSLYRIYNDYYMDKYYRKKQLI